MKKKEKKGNN